MYGYTQEDKGVIPIAVHNEATLRAWMKTQSSFVKNWIQHVNFKAKNGAVCLVPDADGALERVLVGREDKNSQENDWFCGGLPAELPEGIYAFSKKDFDTPVQWERALLAWGLGSYRFTRYLNNPPAYVAKLWVEDKTYQDLLPLISTFYLIRDWINTPAEDMHSLNFAKEAQQVAEECGASVTVTSGEDLLKAGFNAIYTVGRAGSRPPCLIDLQWGTGNAFRLTLVGKGVCFDTGGLNLKPASGMGLMKKDMGGAAHALGFARLIMKANLPVQLRLLIPALENSIDSLSYRPGDIVRTRKGYTVEINNTDAEGRVVLSDALSLACDDKPDLLIDFATLTGDARQALGPELPAFFCNQEDLAQELLKASLETQDLFWRLPLYTPYRSFLKSDIADMTNSGLFMSAGAIVAALFLERFVSPQVPWAHFDIFAWNVEAKPGRRVGAHVAALRALFHYLKKRTLK